MNLSDTIIAMADHDGRGYSARHTTILTIPRLGLLGGLSIERRAKEPIPSHGLPLVHPQSAARGG